MLFVLLLLYLTVTLIWTLVFIFSKCSSDEEIELYELVHTILLGLGWPLAAITIVFTLLCGIYARLIVEKITEKIPHKPIKCKLKLWNKKTRKKIMKKVIRIREIYLRRGKG